MKTHSVLFYTAVFVLTNLPLDAIQRSPLYIPEDATLNFTGLATKYGMFVQEHDVITEDGYILKLFHVPGDKDKTVLLMHGILDSADTFIIRGRRSLLAALASAGYDVWIGNYRGTTYSRRHKRLNPDTDNSFWDYSFHEIGAYDLPAVIDYILRENGVKQLSAIGHSQGNMIFYVLGSVRPEYNDKIKLLIALGPVCYLNLDNFQFPVTTVVETGPAVNLVLQALNQEEVLGETSFLMYLRNTVCTQRLLGYKLCAEGIFFQLAGEDAAEFEPDVFYTLIGHYPTGTSRKNVLHLIQIASDKQFMQFDYGPLKNLKRYNSVSPAVYDLRRVTMKVALLVGRNDKLTPLDNVDLLRKQLPNVVRYHIMENPKFNHIDHVWGKNMDKYLFPHVMNLLGKYS
ncbi:Lipase [Operophtera brumata]|uniref:Lipase n=1 Tax=Operophtera brumata TaxID=104452 RepID=A0A0L7L277_OPEBR|nr:Lipase [Operophtera brumata]KOB69530.1 Lipase [Operophtera brumata]